MNYKKVKYLNVFLLLFFTGLPLLSQVYTEGESYFGRNDYIEYMCGGLPLIISVPHGGDLTPSEIPDRTCGTTVTDSYTYELSQELRTAIFESTGRYPHVIVNHLKRIKMDANRDVAEASCGDPESAIAWNEYQTYIDSAKLIVTRDYEKGLFIDLHGQSSHGPRIELGYLLTRSELQLSDSELNTPTYEDKSSIRNLITNNNNSVSFSELLRGDNAFGTMLENEGYTTVPSLFFEFPTDAYFSGGYNTDRHGSKYGGTIDGIQMECYPDIRFIEHLRLAFADDLAAIILAYLKEHYFTNLEDFYDPSLGIEDGLYLPPVKFFPNPVKDIMHISVTRLLDMEIINLYGQVVYSDIVSVDTDISLSHLTKGIYIMVFRENGEIVAKEKLIIGLDR